MKITEKSKAIAIKVKELLTSPKGWIAFILANIFWSLPWAVQFLIGFIFNDSIWYASATATFALMALPLPIPMWLITPLTAFVIYKAIK